MEPHLTATECHLPYGITQCYLYLPPVTSEHTVTNTHPALTPFRQAGTRFIYPAGWKAELT